MASIEIRGQSFLFDECDRAIIEGRSWWLNPQGYACTKIKRADGSRRSMGMHRLILGDPDSPAIDHINRDRRDNTRANLRATTDNENNRNRATVANKSSAFRGVSLRGGKWQVVIRVNGRLTWLGYYGNEADAGAVAAPYFADIAP